MRVFMEKVI